MPLDEVGPKDRGSAPRVPDGLVEAVCSSPVHGFSKSVADRIALVAGLGVAGDAHAGTTVQHRSRVARDPTQPNLRQVHLLHVELFDDLRRAGFHLVPGAIGENVTTRGIDLLALPTGTRLRLGREAVCEITGLRNPCRQLDDHRAGLMSAVLATTADGMLVRKAGVMAVVLHGGVVSAGDVVRVVLPPLPHRRLEPV